MYRVTLRDSVKLAREFIRKAEETESNSAYDLNIKVKRSKYSGALFRTSMELTRKLSDLRQNR
jgi:hypothetical protein